MSWAIFPLKVSRLVNVLELIRKVELNRNTLCDKQHIHIDDLGLTQPCLLVMSIKQLPNKKNPYTQV